ncbi:class I SAM-dependent methyltransferase [Rubripirellula lacrimiformis]|nr:class I SAM-dependent methyltransferase [Rubripirellula lacrimiformis]
MSISRVLEPKASDLSQEAWDYHNMDLLAVNQRFVTDLMAGDLSAGNRNAPGPAAETPSLVGPRVIDLGCGTAQILILLCQQHSAVEAMGIDSEVAMLEIAKVEIDIAGMLDRILLQHADVTDMDVFEDGMADAVISNTVMHHLDQPELGFATAVRLVRPGGRLFVRDLFRPDTEDQVESLVEAHANGESDSGKQMLRQSLWAALTLDEARQIGSQLGVDPESIQMTSDRHWTIDWIKPDLAVTA